MDSSEGREDEEICMHENMNVWLSHPVNKKLENTYSWHVTSLHTLDVITTLALYTAKFVYPEI